MNRTVALLAAGVAATATVGTAVAVAAAAPHASGTKTVTQHFTAVSSAAPIMLGKTSFVITDKDVAKGRSIGRDVLYCTDTGTGASHCRVAFAQKGGLLYASFAMSDKTGALRGTVTGGTNAFAHAKGTLTGRATSRTKVDIALRYTK